MTIEHIDNMLADVEDDLDRLERRIDDFPKDIAARLDNFNRGIKKDLRQVRRSVHALRLEIKGVV